MRKRAGANRTTAVDMLTTKWVDDGTFDNKMKLTCPAPNPNPSPKPTSLIEGPETWKTRAPRKAETQNGSMYALREDLLFLSESLPLPDYSYQEIV